MMAKGYFNKMVKKQQVLFTIKWTVRGSKKNVFHWLTSLFGAFLIVVFYFVLCSGSKQMFVQKYVFVTLTNINAGFYAPATIQRVTIQRLKFIATIVFDHGNS